MIDPDNVPEVDEDETLARYVFSKSQVRRDNTVKPNLFLPPTDLEMSVTRHRNASDDELWSLGRSIGVMRDKLLIGRADLLTATCLNQALHVVAAPLRENANHAHIIKWPTDKDQQLAIAQELAAVSVYSDCPVT